jgi:hypothetical protein
MIYNFIEWYKTFKHKLPVPLTTGAMGVLFPFTVVGIVLVIVIVVLTKLFAAVGGAFVLLPFPLRAMGWIGIFIIIFAVIAGAMNKIILFFKLPMRIKDFASMYDNVLKSVFMAADSEIFYKIGIYSPQTPDELIPTGTEYEVINGIMHYFVEFRKHNSTGYADERRFKILLKNRLKRFRKAGKLLILESKQIVINRRYYEPLLIMHMHQSRERIIVAFVIADKRSVAMIATTRSVNPTGGDLHDDDA